MLIMTKLTLRQPFFWICVGLVLMLFAVGDANAWCSHSRNIVSFQDDGYQLLQYQTASTAMFCDCEQDNSCPRVCQDRLIQIPTETVQTAHGPTSPASGLNNASLVLARKAPCSQQPVSRLQETVDSGQLYLINCTFLC